MRYVTMLSKDEVTGRGLYSLFREQRSFLIFILMRTNISAIR